MLTALLVSLIAFSPVSAGTVTANITYTTQTTTAPVTSYVVTLVNTGSTPAPPASQSPQTFTSAPATVTFTGITPGTYQVQVIAKDSSGATQGSVYLSNTVTVPAPTGSIPTGSTVTAAP